KEVAYGDKKHIKSMISNDNRVILNIDGYKEELVLDIKSVEGVKECNEEKDLIKLLVDQSKFKLEPLLKLIERHNSKIKGINFEEPSLEEVFLALTGKKLRD